MDQDLTFEVFRGQAQFAYFQLGGAASAIAFAIHETEGQALSITPALLGAAVLAWSLSFAFGCFGVKAYHRALHTNVAYLRAFRGLPRDTAREINAAAVDRAESIVQTDANRPLRRFDWQMWTLFAGALFYIGGHVQQMAHTPAPTAGRIDTQAGK